MTSPLDSAYADEAAVRAELTRVFDVCASCRRCVDLCASFDSLFGLLDGLGADGAGGLTPLEQDRVVDGCSHCQRCVQQCPYAPDAAAAEERAAAVDVPRVVLRARAMQRATGVWGLGRQVGARLTSVPSVVGRVGSALAPVANLFVGAPPRSWRRRALAACAGVSPDGELPRFGRSRFSRWFRRRPGVHPPATPSPVTVVPTCLTEYGVDAVGSPERDLVAVYDRLGVGCSVSDIGCCGSPALFAGDTRRFRRIARRNTGRLARELDRGTEHVVLARAGCAHVIRCEYPRHVDDAQRADADRVADRVVDAAEHVAALAHAGLLPATEGSDSGSVVVPAGRRGPGLPEVDLLTAAGVAVGVADERTGLDPMWAIRVGHEDAVAWWGARLARAVERVAAGVDDSGSTVVIVDGDPSTATSLAGHDTVHPVTLIARKLDSDAAGR